MTMLAEPINKLYPGMGCSSTEFFVVDKDVKVIQNHKVIPFLEIPFSTMEILDEAINSDSEVKKELFDMHPDSKMKRREQFARCRFGGLDFQADIKDGIFQEGEYWDCENRGNCKSEGILCKLPAYNGNILTKQDIQLMQLLTTNKTNEVIASELSLALGSFHKAKKYLYEKLEIQTKQEVTRICCLLNLIQL